MADDAVSRDLHSTILALCMLLSCDNAILDSLERDCFEAVLYFPSFPPTFDCPLIQLCSLRISATMLLSCHPLNTTFIHAQAAHPVVNFTRARYTSSVDVSARWTRARLVLRDLQWFRRYALVTLLG